MTEIPEHLLKRAQAAREKAADESAPAAGGDAAEPASDPRIPAHLLERSRAARAQAGGGEGEPGAEAGRGGGVAVQEKVASVVTAAPTGAGVPLGAGPGGHTQRLLTVVKSGSIQDVKAAPIDKVHTWPHLLAAEFVASLLCLAFTFVFSVFVNAPLLRLANINQTPNPSIKPEDRKFATSLMTVHLMFWAVLVIIGSFFRGPGFNFTLPWRDGLFFEL